MKQFKDILLGNMAPVFLSRRPVEVGNTRIVGEKHIKCSD